MTFQNCSSFATSVKYDMNPLFDKYPQLRALEDCPFFLSSMLMGAYSICWNDNLDIEVKTICENGETEKSPIQNASSHVVVAVRALVGISQKQLAALTGIDQSDI